MHPTPVPSVTADAESQQLAVGVVSGARDQFDDEVTGAEDGTLGIGWFLLRWLRGKKNERSGSRNSRGRDEHPAHQSVHHVSSHGVGGSMIAGRSRHRH